VACTCIFILPGFNISSTMSLPFLMMVNGGGLQDTDDEEEKSDQDLVVDDENQVAMSHMLYFLPVGGGSILWNCASLEQRASFAGKNQTLEGHLIERMPSPGPHTQ